MKKGTTNEIIVMDWLRNHYKDIVDFREFKIAQRMDVDCGIETIDGNIVLAEIKSDNYISETGNLCFEFMRINHFVRNKWFYLGWGWRSPAQNLIVRNPNTGITFIFDFSELRKHIGFFIAEKGKKLEYEKMANNKNFIQIVETDKQKTTFNYLIPMKAFKNIYKIYSVQC